MQFENTISYSLGSPDKPLCLSVDLFFRTISLTFWCALIPQHYYQLNFLSTWVTISSCFGKRKSRAAQDFAMSKNSLILVLQNKHKQESSTIEMANLRLLFKIV